MVIRPISEAGVKVREVQLRNFKRFSNQTFSFADERGLPRDLVVLVGPNGCGKSTLLQAIAATLGCATGRLRTPGDLSWPGFDLELAGRAWERAPEAEVQVVLSNEELKATRKAFLELPKRERQKAFGNWDVSNHPEVRLNLKGDRLDSNTGIGGVLALRGRMFGQRGAQDREAQARSTQETGTVLWYTEHRSLLSINLDDPAEGTATPVTLDLLRARLVQLQSFHSIVLQRRGLRADERDLYADLEERWRTVFPGRSFEGISISGRPEKVMDQPPFFLLDPAGRPYELGEMSGAERAIFPLLFDFANWNIHNSVILIDELELHLHPPLQQALLRALPKLGRNNQFIVTTHSDYIADLVPPEAIIHVEAG